MTNISNFLHKQNIKNYYSEKKNQLTTKNLTRKHIKKEKKSLISDLLFNIKNVIIDQKAMFSFKSSNLV